MDQASNDSDPHRSTEPRRDCPPDEIAQPVNGDSALSAPSSGAVY
jgi:hypothetical protein